MSINRSRMSCSRYPRRNHQHVDGAVIGKTDFHLNFNGCGILPLIDFVVVRENNAHSVQFLCQRRRTMDEATSAMHSPHHHSCDRRLSERSLALSKESQISFLQNWYGSLVPCCNGMWHNISQCSVEEMVAVARQFRRGRCLQTLSSR